ncbi:MAG: hypothetical protein QXD23_01915 [Candidatus Micrarchaeaceae archaeon]
MNRNTFYVVVAFIVIIFVLYLVIGIGQGVTFVGSQNGKPIYLNYSQGYGLIGSVSDYGTFDLFNTTIPLNITFINQVTPYAAGNVLEGWLTIFLSSNSTRNASLEFFVMKGNNISLLNKNFTQGLQSIFPKFNINRNGSYSGFNYNYLEYSNNTVNDQFLISNLGNYSVIMYLSSKSQFNITEYQMLNTIKTVLG